MDDTQQSSSFSIRYSIFDIQFSIIIFRYSIFNIHLQTKFFNGVPEKFVEPGDLIISGVIKGYDREGLGYLNRDASTTQNYRVGVTVHVMIRERVSGKTILDRDVKGHTLVNVGPDFASSERQAAPLLAANLAQNIVELLAEGAW